MLLNQLCPCGSQTPYAQCCGPYHTGKAVAPTAEALMRSRYSAYAKGNLDYLLDTLHPSQRKRGDRLSLSQSLNNTRWISLQILETQQGRPEDSQGMVEFVAVYDRPELGQMHERSRFVQEQGRWFYLDGDLLPPHRPRRNEPCWCQSGKPFKQCHARNPPIPTGVRP